MTPALLVGSRPAWLAKLRPHLASVGIDVRWTWEEPGAPRAGLPPGAALMLIATDCNSHALSEAALRLARAHALRVVHLSHRWAHAAPLLARAGFSALPTPEEKPMSLPLSVTIPLSAPPDYPLPPVRTPIRAGYVGALPAVVRALAHDPSAGVPALALAAGHPTACVYHLTAYARAILGLRATRGTTPAVADTARYRAWCAHLGITPAVELAADVEAAPDADVEPAFASAPASGDSLPPASESDVRAACALLLDAMREHGFTRVTLTADGVLTWDRTITTTGTATL